MSATDRPAGPVGPEGSERPGVTGREDHDDDNEETTAMTTPFASTADHRFPDSSAAGSTAGATAGSTADHAVRPDRPLDDPLPYGAGFTPTQQFGHVAAPEPVRYTPPPVATRDRERAGSPILAAAGLLSLGVAVWAILGAPMITTTVMLAGALVIAVLVGLVMVVRR